MGRDVVTQTAKVAPGVMKTATNGVNETAQNRVNQIISQGSKEMELVLPKILQEAIEDVYQTLFGLLGNSGKQQLNEIK